MLAGLLWWDLRLRGRMKLKGMTISDLAEMTTGGAGSMSLSTGSRQITESPFPYRSGPKLTEFFYNCDLDHEHTGSRIPWTKEVLKELNEQPASQPDLPSDALVRVIQEFMDPVEFERAGKDRGQALAALNTSLSREGLEACLDEFGRCQLRHGDVMSTGVAREGGWTKAELERRERWEGYLRHASEDDFTERVLNPLLRACGFQAVKSAGHTDKAQEFGKDVRMKFRLPTGHFIYFAIQVKKGKLDAAGKTKAGNENITEVLNQVQMALGHPIFDSEVNLQVLIDHVMVVATGEITKMAEQFLVGRLDAEKRRHLLFMDQSKLLDVLARRDIDIPPLF